MSDAFECDRCGDLNKGSRVGTIQVQWSGTQRMTIGRGTTCKSMELCALCLAQLDGFLQRPASAGDV